MKKLPHFSFKGIYFLFFLVCSIPLSAQSISGKITDTKNEPLVGASVLVKGTNNGTVTNTEGVFNFGLMISNVGIASEIEILRG